MAETLVIRADASVAMGTGHIMRCLALAQAWQDAGGDVLFAFAEITPALEARVLAEQMRVVRLDCLGGSLEDASRVSRIAVEHSGEWVVVDGHHFDSEYQRHLKKMGLRVLLVDDIAQSQPYSADVVLNQNCFANASLYKQRATHTQLLLGTRYALLRREFWPWRSDRIRSDHNGNVLVMAGGTDPYNVTSRLIDVLSHLPTGLLRIRVIVGEAHPFMNELGTAVQKSKHPVQIDKGPKDLALVMRWADLAITAAGTTCWELAFMGVPSLLLTIAEHQKPVAECLEEAKAGINMGWLSDVPDAELANSVKELLENPGRRRVMSKNNQRLVDGYGAERVLASLVLRSKE